MLENGRKNIAVLVGHPEEYAHTNFLKGFLEEAFSLDYNVMVFAMYVKYQNTQARCKGDSSIFQLVPYDKFDCIVVMADTIQIKGLVEQIEQDLRDKYKGKVIFVNRSSEYFPSIHSDNYTPEKLIIDHLIEEHGIRDIAFLTGKSWHTHSKIRLKAYKDSLKEHGIEFNEDRIFYGDFWYTSGESLADSLIKSGAKLPQAVACANDCMALGFAKVITANGYKIPDDIVVVGCDSTEEGRHSPIPLTSISFSPAELGKNTLLMADSLINGTEFHKLSSDPELFIGGTCGCNCESAIPTYVTRTYWDTEMSLATIFSPFNFMDEDLIAQTTFSGLIGTIFGSIHFILGFDSFNLCLNPSLGDSDQVFEDKIMHVIRCTSDPNSNDKIFTDTYFDKDILLPELNEKRDKPSVYYFMPLFYDDSVFGYASVRFDELILVVSPEYRAWLRSVSRGIEYFKRSDALVNRTKIAIQGITTDSLTGLFNYKGFLDQADILLQLMENNGGHMDALAIDIKNISTINNTYGRGAGDRVIANVAAALNNIFSSRNCLCLRPGNDELVALRVTSIADGRELLEEKDKLLAMIEESYSNSEIKVELYYGIESGMPTTTEEVERLVNLAISHKNKNKADTLSLTHGSLSEEEQKEAQTVMEVLVDNKISYHFQPIVDVKTGNIYSYEALMRPQVIPYMPPPVILRYAEFYNRLYDVERLTFFNVIREMKKHSAILSDGRKVFINSIPGYMLTDDDMKQLSDYVSSRPGSIVVELTEQSEVSDSELKRMKSVYSQIGIETAVDDYGTGYSNVSNLLRYTPNYVKIDRALLSGIQESPQKQHFVKDVIEFAHNNGIVALAEGVETSEELRTVIMLGADLVQGYYLAYPDKDMIQSINSTIAEEVRRYFKLRQSST